MHFVRRSAYHTLSVLFFIFLVLTAWSVTTTLTFTKPDRLESWLTQSKLYDHFIATAIDQAQKSVQTDQGQGLNSGLSLNDPGVQQAVTAAFTPQTLQNAVNTFLDANYRWLDGKTATPNFTIDLTQAKAALAANLAAYAEKRAATLPKCTTLEGAQGIDPLTITCLPPGITPAMIGQSAQDQIATSKDFLADPVITAQTLNQSQGQGSTTEKQPYYVKLSQLPKAYRVAKDIPWIVSVLSVLCGAGIVLLGSSRRRGVRRVGTLLVASGVVILALIFISKAALSAIEHRVFTNDAVGQLQESLVNFAHRAQNALVRVDLWFGIAFILAGVAVYLSLKFFWPGNPKQSVSDLREDESTPVAPPKPKTPTLIQL